MVDVSDVLKVVDGDGTPQNMATMRADSGAKIYQMQVRQNGVPVDVINTTNPTLETATGTPADAAWSGSGSGGLIAILKALWTALTGVLTTSSHGVTVGAAVAPFAVTTVDQAITGLTLPGKVRITYPQYVLGTANINTGQVQVNYAGGDAAAAPSAALAPGQIDDWINITGTIAPHVAMNSGTGTILVQQ